MGEEPEPKIIKLKGKDRYQRLLSDLSDTKGMKAGHMNLKPGESVGEHGTGAKEEAVIILKGKAEISVNSRDPLTVEENTIVYIPPETKHDVKNIGTENLKYVYVVSPVNVE